jgi:hypothetical protein
MEEYLLNARTKVTVLHEKHSPYENYSSTANFLRESFENEFICGPIIYCNSGIEVDLLKDEKNSLELFEKCKKDRNVTRAVLLCGDYSFIRFQKGASLLSYADSIKPTLHSDFSICDIDLYEKGKLERDPYPHGWDELDWRVYDLMRKPFISFSNVSMLLRDEFDVTWKTIENRYKKIADFCKILIGFFPKGRKAYAETFLTFKTEYEIGLVNELKKLDRSSYLYKVGNLIILNLFLDCNKEHFYFLKLQKEGKIKNLSVSIPVWHVSPLDND